MFAKAVDYMLRNFIGKVYFYKLFRYKMLLEIGGRDECLSR